MKGETLQWWRIAERLHMSPQRAMRELSSTDFVRAGIFLEQEVNFFHREDYFFAQICVMIAGLFSKDPSKITIPNFLLKFEPKKEEPAKPKPVVEETADQSLEEGRMSKEQIQKMKMSQSYWLAAVGFSATKKVLPPGVKQRSQQYQQKKQPEKPVVKPKRAR